ncbi:MAG: sugar phosphate isomerase/epimerase [Candidatus Hydrogenedentes bacterium]|nr:sugar phosphate isomerase/epimerase [Candidatus Hydrogenedentota bacterium]
MAKIPYALQLYTVRDHIAKDFAGTLKKVKEVGYDYIELAGLGGVSAAECKKILDQVKLTAISNHVGYEEMIQKTDEVIAMCRTLNIRFIVVPWLGKPFATDKASWIKCAQALDAAGTKLKAAGIRLCYHNHAHEFEKFDGEYALDILYANSSPDHVAGQLDTYWLKHGGVDPVAYIRKYSGRCPLIHVKDMSAGEPHTFAEVGRGILDWKAIFGAGNAAGAQWYIVEQDTCPGDSLESARISAEFMAKQK